MEKVEPAVVPPVLAEPLPLNTPQEPPEAPPLMPARFLVMAAQYWPECEEDADDFDPLDGWKSAKAAFVTYDEAVAFADRFIGDNWWAQIVDLATLMLIFSSDAPPCVMH